MRNTTKSEGAPKGLPKVPRLMGVLWELYINCDVNSPYSLFSEQFVNQYYVQRLFGLIRFARTVLLSYEQNLEMIERAIPGMEENDHGAAVVEQQSDCSEQRSGQLQLGGVEASEVAVQEPPGAAQPLEAEDEENA